MKSPAPSAGNHSPAGDVTKATGLLITEDEIATLPAWQQELLSDPGWNQPYIEPREPTPIEAPTNEMFMEYFQEGLERGVVIEPRATTPVGKSVSWDDQGDFDGITAVNKGEYFDLAPGATPDYGCNKDDWNTGHGNAIEDVITAATMLLDQRISWVLEGWSVANHFNATGGSQNSNLSAVYQLFSTDRSADPLDLESTAEFGELSYRSDLAPGVGPLGDCSLATAYSVTGCYWRGFNKVINALPSHATTAAYNFLIAPSGDMSVALVSSAGTTGKWQPFYFGTVSPCYGGGWVTGLESSTDPTMDTLIDTSPACFFHNPIYGVLLKRWQDAALPGMAGAWESEFGWPVYGPIAYASGSQVLTASGTYYAWGFWFERGFIWWIDYDQALYPNTPDEAQAYRYWGTNVYARDGVYEPIAPTVYYGGSGPLGVSVVVDSYRETAGDPWLPTPLSEDGTYYQVPLSSDDGLAIVSVMCHAHGYGGNPNADCLYKWYVWSWRDGTIDVAGADYDTAQMYKQHPYGSLTQNEESVYVIRVQVTDASFDLGMSPTEVHGYGDALPLHLGHGSGGAGGEILVIRNDNNNYPTNYNALMDDLDTLGCLYTEAAYSDTIANTYDTGGYRVAIWYRGGPGAGGETQPDTQQWTSTEVDNMIDICDVPGNLLLISQAHQCPRYPTPDLGTYPYYWTDYYGCTDDLNNNYGNSLHFNGFEGFERALSYFVGAGTHTVQYNSHCFVGGSPTFYTMGSWSADCADRYAGSGSSGLPVNYMDSGNRQMTTRGHYGYNGFGHPNYNPGWTNGTTGVANSGHLGSAMVTYGNEDAPGFPTGSGGRYWCCGLSWSEISISDPASMTRADLLHNYLGWLDPGLTYGSSSGPAFDEYAGPPEILQVTPVSWFGSGGTITPGATSVTGDPNGYPDPTGTDIYRDTVPGGASANANYIIHSRAGVTENGITPNDIDFQFPWYAYIEDPDASLSGGTGVTGDEILTTYGGLLVDDVDGNWSRVDPGMAGYANWDIDSDDTGAPDNDGNAENDSDWGDIAGWDPDMQPVAGYYVTTTVGGDTGDETRANYGTNWAHLLYYSASEPITFESIAHWPETLMYGSIPAYLGWSCYPGHTAFDPVSYAYYGSATAPWNPYFTTLDIDPTVPTAPANRDSQNWLNYDFNYTQLIADGRVVEFDYTGIDAWNPDLNKNASAGDDPGDKLPVRCRLYTDFDAYDDYRDGSYAYPDHWPDPATFLEGGCYIVDQSSASFGGPPTIVCEEIPYTIGAGYTVRWDTGAATYPTTPVWTGDITFTIVPGAAVPVAVFADLNADPTPSAGNFDPDILVGNFATTGTHTVSLSFTASDVDGGSYVWSNGDQHYLALRGMNTAGEGYCAYSTQMWLGDIVMFEDFEPPFQDSDIIECPDWWGWDPIYPPGSPDYLFDWYFHTQSITDKAWVEEPTSRSWVSSPQEILGTQCVFCDDGSEYYTGGYWRPLFAPALDPGSDDDVYFFLRQACHMTNGDLLNFCMEMSAYGSQWGDYLGRTLDSTWGTWDDGDHLIPEVEYCNMSAYSDDQGWIWRLPPSDGRYGDLGGICRFGKEMYIFYGGSGGFLFDNWLWTHASAEPWWI